MDKVSLDQRMHIQEIYSCLQIEVLYFGVQGLTYLKGEKSGGNCTSLVPRISREAGIKSRERGPGLKEKLLATRVTPNICSG